MSELRKQLEQGRREHRDLRYPGDLAADLLHVRPTRLGYGHTPRRGWLFWTNVGALGAVAATVALVMWRVQPESVVHREGAKPNHQIVATANQWQPRADDEFSIVPQLAGATLTPRADESSGGTAVPAAPTAGMMPAMPSFPSLSDVMKSADAATTSDSTNNNS